MRILFITDNFPPEVNAPATRTYEHCKEWVRQGAEVTVLTCAPNFPQGKVYPGYRNKLVQKEDVEGIRVVRLWSYITANQGFLKRSLDYLSFACSSFFAGLFQKADIIVATSPQFFTTWSGCLLSKLKRRPWIFELRDIWPESIRTVGAMEQSRILEWLEKVELYLYAQADRVIALTPAFKQNLTSRGVEEEKVHIVPNGANLDICRNPTPDADLASQLGLQDKFVVSYIGTHGLAHGLDFIVSCLQYIEDPQIHFLFIGDGAEKSRVQELAAELGLSNATFLDPIPKHEVPRYMSISQATLVPLKKADTFKSVIPSKIFEGAAMEIPILLGVKGQAREIVQEHNAGLCFEPENKKDFLSQLLALKSDPELYRRLQQGCRDLASTYDRKKLAKQMLDSIQEVVANH